MASLQKLHFTKIKSDTDFINKTSELNNWLTNLHEHLEKSTMIDIKSLCLEDRITYNLFQMYAINSMCWIQLRLRGVDPNTHPVKKELQRIRQLMQKKNEIIERRKRPMLDKGAAKRFIRSGLWDPKNKDLQNGPVNKKIKFSDD